jgi:hypothetical protein
MLGVRVIITTSSPAKPRCLTSRHYLNLVQDDKKQYFYKGKKKKNLPSLRLLDNVQGKSNHYHVISGKAETPYQPPHC